MMRLWARLFRRRRLTLAELTPFRRLILLSIVVKR